MSVDPQLVLPGDARARWHLGGLLTIRAAAGDTNGAIAVVEERAARGYATPPHVHGREDETLFVIDGTLEYTVDGSVRTANAGEAVHLPKGLAHRFEVVSEEAHFLVIITPGGFEEFFEEVSPPAEAARIPDHTHTDPADMVRAAGARGTTVFRDHETAVRAAAWTAVSSDDMTEILLAYRQLGAALVEPAPPLANAGEITDMLVDTVTERLPTAPLHARALVLLGILVERYGADTARWDIAVPRLLRTAGPALDDAAVLAMAYLLAHFPDHEAAVLDAMHTTELSEEDRQRLERCLAKPDPAVLGRVWPSPSVWQLDADERQLDETWRAGLQLDTETAEALWESETVALLAYMGAKADHAVERTNHA